MWAWLDLASHLHCSLATVMRETSSSTFVLWCAYLKRKREIRDRDDYRFAMLAAEVRRSYVKKGVKVKLTDLLLNWKKPKPMSKKEYTKRSKAGWFAAVGLGKKKKKEK